MSQVKRIASNIHRKQIIDSTKGYRNRSKNCFRIAIQKMYQSLSFSYRDRKNRKRVFRALWIQKINAMVRRYGIKYSNFMNFLKRNNIVINRKILSRLAMDNSTIFSLLLSKMKRYNI